MAKLPWFKHYNTASEGQLVGDLIAKKQYEAACLFYVILELISRYEDPIERGKCSVPIERIAIRMNMKPSRIDRLIAQISAVSRSDLICTMDEEQPRNRVFLMRNWLKLQETRGGKRWSKNEQNAGRSKKLEVRSKKEKIKKENLANPPSELFAPQPGLESLAGIFSTRNVQSKLQVRWLETYSDPSWICDQIRRALTWETANPKKAKKDFGRFVTNWLANATEWNPPKTTKAKPQGKTLEEAMKELYPDQWQEPTDAK